VFALATCAEIVGVNLVFARGGKFSMEASIIVINYNSLPYLKSCLESLRTNTDRSHEIIIVDNHSTDQSEIFLKGIKHPNIRVILNEANYGYAAACNQGVNLAKGRVLITMNPDVLVPSGWLSRMIWHLGQHPDTLAVGPKGIGIGGRQAALPLSYSSKLTAAARQFAAEYARQSEPAKYLIGCFFLFDRRLIKEVGYFDAEMPLGADDFDISLRIRKAGYQLRIARDVLIKHFVHVAFHNSDPGACKIMAEQSYRHFYQKWSNELNDWGWNRLFDDETPVFPHETLFPSALM
jgi:GT2 family glycosyltransferase